MNNNTLRLDDALHGPITAMRRSEVEHETAKCEWRLAPFHAAYIDPADLTLEALRKRLTMGGVRVTDDLIERTRERLLRDQIVKNDTYQVNVCVADVPDGFPAMLHLSIKRLDREPIHDWRDLQAIKNALVGDENEGVELYPAESRTTDTANQYHLWVFVNTGNAFPFGWDGGVKLDETHTSGGAKQRPFHAKE
jgi:hypothetical protein